MRRGGSSICGRRTKFGPSLDACRSPDNMGHAEIYFSSSQIQIQTLIEQIQIQILWTHDGAQTMSAMSQISGNLFSQFKCLQDSMY